MENKIANSERINTGNLTAHGNINQYFGDTVQYGENKIPRFLTSPPFTPEVVLGRETDLSTVGLKLWNENHLLLLINGEGGIGKTTLAARYWLDNADNYQHLAWLYADGGVQSALFSLSSQINVTFDASASDEDRWGILLQQLANLNKPCLLVLDNANDLTDLQKHYKHLRRLPNFHIVLTTRVNELADAPVWQVRPLDPEISIVLFNRYYPHLSSADGDLLPQVLLAVGYNTLVIELLAKNLRELNRIQTAYTLQNLLADLQQKGLLQLQSRPVQTTYGGTELRTAKPDEIVRAMYNLTQLSRSQVWLLNNLAVLPAESIAYERLAELLTPNEGETLDESVLELHKRGWIDWSDADKAIKISPVVQAVVRDKNQPNLLVDCEGLVAALISVFKSLNCTQAESYAGLVSNVLHVLPDAGSAVAHLYLAFGDYNEGLGDLSSAFDLFRRAATVFNEIGSEQNYAYCLRRLGCLYQEQGQLEKALFHFEGAKNLLEELYAINPRSESLKAGLAVSHTSIGLIYQAQGQLKQALNYFERRRDLFDELCQGDLHSADLRAGLAASYANIGDIHRGQGQFEQALIDFKECLKLTDGLYRGDIRSESLKTSLAAAHEKLGEIYQIQGNLEQALFHFQEEKNLFDQLYQINHRSVSMKNGLTISYGKIGEVYQAQNDQAQALTYFEKYSCLFEELYQSNPRSERLKNGLAISYTKIGEVYYEQGKFDQSLIYFEKHTKLAEELYANNPRSVTLYNSLGTLYANLGVLCLHTNEKERAVSYLWKAEQVWSVLCDQVNIPEYRTSLARVRQDLANLE